MSESSPNPALGVAMMLLGVVALVCFLGLGVYLFVSVWCDINDGHLPRPWIQGLSTWAFWGWVLAGFPAVILYSVRRKSVLVGIITTAFVAAVPTVLIMREASRVQRAIVDVVVVNGEGYGVMQTAALMAPDTYVEIVRVEAQSMLTDQYTPVAPTQMHDFGPVDDGEVVERGDLWTSSYGEDYGFIVELQNGWIVAGLGSESVEVGYDPKARKPVSADALEAKFGLR